MIAIQPPYEPLYTNRDKFIILITGGRGSGKCLKKATRVIMADLTLKNVEDIVVGDFVMGDDFTPRKVLTTNKGYGELYRITQSSGVDYVVNKDHIITIKKSKASENDRGGITRQGSYRRPLGRYPEYSAITDMSILEFDSQSDRFKSHFRGYKCNSIPFTESKVEIDPYMLGIWLGDGTSIFPQVTTMDVEIVEYLKRYASTNGMVLTTNSIPKGRATTYRLRKAKGLTNPFMDKLRCYDLIGNKHIPQCYISNSEKVRLELLAGIIDTDGYMHCNGYTITQKNKDLSNQIKLIADTLGFKTSIKTRNAKCNGVDVGVVYNVNINGDVWRIPCKIARKTINKEDCRKNKDWHLSSLKLSKDKDGEWFGFSLDGNHRFLLEDGTVTHNSFNGMTFIERLTFEPKHKILLTRYTMSSASLSVIPEFRDKVEREGTQKYFKITEKDAVNLMTDSVVMFRGIKTSSGNQTANLKSIQGLTTFVVDEGEEWVSETDYDKLVLSIRTKGIQNRIIIIMNPTDVNHFIYQKYIKDTHELVNVDGVQVQVSTHPNVLHIHTSYLDNMENLSKDFLDEAKAIKEKDKEKGTTKYANVVIGRWADMSEGAIFKNWEVVDEIPSHIRRKRGRGMDFGYTNDPTAIVECAIDGEDLYIDELCYRTHMSTSDIIKELKSYPIQLKIISESADPRLVDEIKNAGLNVHAVNKGKRDGKGSIIAGIDKMLEYNVKITRRSKNVQYEFKNYLWGKDKFGVSTNEPETNQEDHAIDAVRYWILEEVLGNNGEGLTLQEMFG